MNGRMPKAMAAAARATHSRLAAAAGSGRDQADGASDGREHLDAIAGGARCCYFVPTDAHDGKGFIPSLVVEGVAGHVPMSGQGEFASPWYWGDTYEQATRICEKVNRDRGVLPESAAIIVASSMGATAPRKAGAR